MSRRAIKFIGEYGAAAFLPRKLPGGKWGSPYVSARIAANIRKQSLKDGSFGSFSVPQGGWLKEWDKHKKPIIRKPLKMPKEDRNRGVRFDRINAKLEEQPKLIAQMRKTKIDAKPTPGIHTLYKRLVAMRGGS